MLLAISLIYVITYFIIFSINKIELDNEFSNKED